MNARRKVGMTNNVIFEGTLHTLSNSFPFIKKMFLMFILMTVK